MKTYILIKKASTLINIFILAGTLTLGILGGILFGEIRYGVVWGLAIGLTGLTGFQYYLQKLSKMKIEQKVFSPSTDKADLKKAA